MYIIIYNIIFSHNNFGINVTPLVYYIINILKIKHIYYKN